MLTIELTGVTDVQDACKRAALQMKAKSQSAVATIANSIAEEAKQNSKGKLAESITVSIDDDGMGATIGTAEPYAAAVEYGAEVPAIQANKAKALHWVEDGKDVFAHSAKAHTDAPRPFLNPAFEANRQSFINKLSS